MKAAWWMPWSASVFGRSGRARTRSLLVPGGFGSVRNDNAKLMLGARLQSCCALDRGEALDERITQDGEIIHTRTGMQGGVYDNKVSVMISVTSPPRRKRRTFCVTSACSAAPEDDVL